MGWYCLYVGSIGCIFVVCNTIHNYICPKIDTKNSHKRKILSEVQKESDKNNDTNRKNTDIKYRTNGFFKKIKINKLTINKNKRVNKPVIYKYNYGNNLWLDDSFFTYFNASGYNY